MIADDLVAAFEPWLTPDLETYLRAVAEMLAEVEGYVGQGEDDAWTTLFDPDLVPLNAIPYLAQYLGERAPVGITEQQGRDLLRRRPTSRRGTKLAIVAAAQRTLIGNRTVTIRERHPDIDTITVNTYTAETPNSAAVEADLRATIPADVTLSYAVFDGQDWQQLLTAQTTWSNVNANYPTWGDVASDIPEGDTYTDPL